tara:strand:- start:635 stop:1117 length:483 start_codon:yes stop_codon:yes gene_type:complete
MTTRKYRFDQKEIKNELTRFENTEIMEEKGYARVTGQERITTTVFLFDTPIVSFYYDNEKNERGNRMAHIELTSGGHNTPLTKRRINQVAKFYGLGFHVSQHKSKWYTALMNNITGLQYLKWVTFDPAFDHSLGRLFDMKGLTYCGFSIAPSESVLSFDK